MINLFCAGVSLGVAIMCVAARNWTGFWTNVGAVALNAAMWVWL